ncbi:nucleolar protein 7 [Spea bombifrons]|uniref:nucleolar protein 7 n=1 Tax=Spea bombifrons TaxID=233779 RepID=UPI00234B8558|nr:nucleolar protein 7 [Spea bombifrons]
MSPDEEYESPSGDDEAPEEVTFQSAKNQAEENTRKRQQASKREKALLKEKRKLKEELFKEQKKRKLLSQDILQTIASTPGPEEKPKDAVEIQNQDDTEAKNHAKKTKEKKLLPKKRLQNNYSVVHLEDYSMIQLQEQKAKKFIQKKLYGKGKNRTTANEFLSMTSKREAFKKPAVLFTDSNWAKDEKIKAEKFTVAWRNRRKL